MAHLIRKEERIKVTRGGSDWYYRRMPATVKARLTRKAKTRGLVDYDKLAWLALNWGLLDWGRVTANADDGTKVEIKFDAELLEFVDEETRADLVALIMTGRLEEDTDLRKLLEDEDEDPMGTSEHTSEPS